jgi:predicted DNA-binding transcriptional regulator YafY
VKSQRLLEILLLLQARSPRVARELAQSLNVTERTIYRDVDSLSAAGIPVFTIRGSRGGVGLLEGYRQAVSNLLEHEIRALFASGPDPLADLGFGEQLTSAREKLFGALSQAQRQYAIKVRERIRIEPRQWAQAPQPLQTLSMLRLAVWEDRIAHVSYRNQKGGVTLRSLHPLGIVFKAGVWYCVALHKNKASIFRVERMLSIDVSPARFKRPRNFKLDEYWEQSQARYESNGPSCVVQVKGAKKDLEQLAVFWPTRMEVCGEPEQASAEVCFQHPGQAVHELLAWSSLVEVVSPAFVREDVLDRLQSAIDRYQQPPGSTGRCFYPST